MNKDHGQCPDVLAPGAEGHGRCLDALRAGGVVLIPTDTVYGLACAMSSAGGLRRIYEMKGRPDFMPCALLLADAASARELWAEEAGQALDLARQRWPGAVTIIGAKSPKVPDHVTADRPTVGLRLPDNAFVRALARDLGEPLAATSANLSGGPAPRDLASIPAAIRGACDVRIDAGVIDSRGASEVIDASVTPPAVLRR